jgi:transcriptional regulator with XRE-family HTH domain
MEIYERIKIRRKELGLSASDVADALGISRATVYRYESADIEKLPTTIIEPLSKILHCSVAYLMGWDDALEEPLENDFVLSTLEKRIIEKFRLLNDSERSMFLRSIGILEFEKDEENLT